MDSSQWVFATRPACSLEILSTENTGKQRGSKHRMPRGDVSGIGKSRRVHQAVFLHLLVERDAADAKRAGGTGSAISIVDQGPMDDGAFELIAVLGERIADGLRFAIERLGIRLHGRGE